MSPFIALIKPKLREPPSHKHTEMKMMKPATLLLKLSIIFILTLTASSQLGFKCNTTSTCESLIDYVPPDFTTISQIQSLFSIENLRSILGANSFPLNTPPTQPISAKQRIKIPFPCICINGSGISNKIPVYKVKADDTLGYISRTIFVGLVTYLQIAAVNNISNPDLIETEVNLWIPLPCSCNPLINGTRVVHYGHVVEEGNSVEQVAQKYGTTEDTLLMLNGISYPKTLDAGTVLDVPLRACSSKIRNTSLDYPLLVTNGTYTFTANTCVQCKCESSNNWTLHCEPSPTDQVKLRNRYRCPSTQCQGSENSSDNLFLGNNSSPESSCDRKACSYAGYTNQTIFTTIVNESYCVANGGPRTTNGPYLNLQGSRCWWHIISLCLSLLLFGLLT